MNYKNIDLNAWPRFEHFKFYRAASDPWFNICCEIDATELYHYCKQQQLSFFHGYLFLTQQAVNTHQAFQYRMVEQEVRIYSDIAISVAILGDDEMMRFCNLEYHSIFSKFTASAAIIEQAVKAEPFIAANFVGGEMLHNVIHMSVLPWISFTSFSNARNTQQIDSIPKIVFGKCSLKQGRMMMPLSVEVHHGMMDGLHVGKLVETLQALFDAPANLMSMSD